MATSLPYLASNKNVEALFGSIYSAKVPDKFTQIFLQNTLGLKGTNDRQVIPLLRNLKFLDTAGNPTASYRLLKSKETSKAAIASGVREAYAALFAANENAHSLSPEKLKGLVAQVAGTDEDMTSCIVSTLTSLIKQGDFTKHFLPKNETTEVEATAGKPDDYLQTQPVTVKPMNPEFHYNIQIHLPNNATEEVYLNIFNAVRKTFQ